MKTRNGLLIALLAWPAAVMGAPPALPEGLNGGPELPKGLGGDSAPALPQGLDGGSRAGDGSVQSQDSPETEGYLPGRWRLDGFVESRIGPRLTNPVDQERLAIAEVRTELKALGIRDNLTFTLRIHGIGDGVAEQHRPNLQNGAGALDLREANLLWRATDFMDIKAGRQILTWGTGDFLFLNDLFPKDYKSFFIGRHDTMLKAPSDAIKVSLFSGLANLDLVYTPQFDSDRFITGDRLSYFNPFTGRIQGESNRIRLEQPDAIFGNDEWAARLHRQLGRYSTALYFYDGYWKSPTTLLPASRQLSFSRLRSYGASIRGPLPAWGGIFHGETAWYQSREDGDGDDPLVPNSELRWLLGYDKEAAQDLTLGFQYQQIHRLEGPPPGIDGTQRLWTLKVEKSWPRQQVNLRLFTFYSPSDEDAYLRPRIDWSPTDRWTLEAGVNFLTGNNPDTQFGQLEDNTNAFVAGRWGF